MRRLDGPADVPIGAVYCVRSETLDDVHPSVWQRMSESTTELLYAYKNTPGSQHDHLSGWSDDAVFCLPDTATADALRMLCAINPDAVPTFVINQLQDKEV